MKFEFDPSAVTTTMCAALQKNRCCLAVKIIDETGEMVYRKFFCKKYKVNLKRRDTQLYRRPVVICDRCPQCLIDNRSGCEADFDNLI